MDAQTGFMYFQTVKPARPKENPFGWEIVHGNAWAIHEHMDPALISAIEARRFSHFDGTEPLVHTGWVLDYHFTNGIRYNTGTGGWQQRVTGTWQLYGPDLVYRQDSRRSRLPLHALWLRFHGAERLGLRRLVDNPLHVARIHDPGGWLLQKVRSLAVRADTLTEAEYPEALIGLMEVCQRLLQCKRQSPLDWTIPLAPGDTLQDPLAHRAHEYIVAHLHERLPLERIARALRTSVTTLKRRYAATHHETLTQSVIRMRVNRVKQLLRDGETVDRAALLTGFCDAFHLSKTFRRLEGLPPRDYVARLRVARR